MKTATLKIEPLSWWHAGSGLGRGGGADSLVIRDKEGLPYLPGKTVKGLLRDAVQLAADHGAVGVGCPDELFGPIDPTTLDAHGAQAYFEPPGRRSGILHVTNAKPSTDLSNWLLDGGPAREAALFETISATALNDAGVVEPRTLRTIEVCPPLQLTATLSGPDDGRWLGTLKRCIPLIRSLGSHRHRGLGRCRVSLTEDPPAAGVTGVSLPATGGCVWLEIHLLADVIVSLRGATTGGHDSLDYLPGSALLGAAAAPLFQQHGFGPDIFLSGKVRFEDGLPLAPDGHRGWPVPLNCQFIKKQGPEGKVINGLTDTKAEADTRTKNKEQAQQLRTGHLTTGGTRFDVEGDYLLKTTLDRCKFGRAKDRQLFEYETLAAGAKFQAAIRWNHSEPALADKVAEIVAVLTGPGIALGRSRSAQFGRVQIAVTVQAPSEPSSLPNGAAAPENGAPKHPLHFYLASDLALGGGGGARLVPDPADFGLPRGWLFRADRSFVRTRRYSPWNAFHHSRLTERQVLTRGSVLTFAREDDQAASPGELQTVRQKLAKSLGEHREEGLGWAMLNPDFVLKLPELQRPLKPGPRPAPSLSPPASAPVLADWIQRRQIEQEIQVRALNLGRQWAEEWRELHEAAARAERLGRSGRSQWNEVRQQAIRARDDAAKLRHGLAGFCANGLRRKFWTHPVGHRSLWGELQAALGPGSEAMKAAEPGADRVPQGPLVCTAIAVAAETIIRHLQETDNRSAGSEASREARAKEPYA